jgi:uncharacterized protein with HEPN domain
MAASGNPRVPLEHILFHIRGVADTVAGVDFETYAKVYHMERTVERAVQIISEAARSLPPALTARYPQIEWVKIAAIGNVLRHEYERVDPQTMWEIATVKLPEMQKIIERMLADLKA